MKRNKKSIFAQRYLRAVGQRWMCPADSLPCFFKLTWLMKAEMPETQLSSAESPMQGNNWRPAHPDGGERPTFFISFLPQNFIRSIKLSLTPIWCYGIVLMCHNKEQVLILLGNGVILETNEDIVPWEDESLEKPFRLGIKGNFYKYQAKNTSPRQART